MNCRRKSSSCKFCGKSFFLQSCLITHELKHKGDEETEEEYEESTSNIGNEMDVNIVEVAAPPENIVEVAAPPERGVKNLKEAQSNGLVEGNIRKNGKPHSCHVCGKQYSLKSMLKTHLIGHKAPKQKHFCVLCNRNFEILNEFLLHMKTHEVKKFQCSVCQKEYPSQALYSRHINRGHKLRKSREKNILKFAVESTKKGDDDDDDPVVSKKLKSKSEHLCSICREKFPTKSILNEHKEKHEKDLTCVMCNKKFNTYKSLQCHVRVHLDMKPHFLCEICGRVLRKKSYAAHLLTHAGRLSSNLKIHRNDKNFNCDLCGRGFCTQQTFDQHCLLHAKKGAYECDLCDDKFSRWSLFQQHERQFHPDKLMVCKICNEHFDYSSQLFIHYIQHSEEDLEKLGEKTRKLVSQKRLLLVTCQFCGKYVDKHKLKAHIRLHSGDKPYKCELCDKSFRLKNGLTLHMVTHSEERPYICDFCGKTFRRVAHLRTHLPLHLDEKPYECDVCGKTFPLQNYLHNHKRLYHELNTKRPSTRVNIVIECEECGVNVSGWHNHHLHEKAAHPEKRFFCQICNEEFPSSSRLYIHYAHHLEEDLAKLNEKTRKMVSLKKLLLIKCECCDKYVNRTQIKVHMRLHTGEKPYKCEYCEKSFRLVSGFINHKRIHTGERPFKCGLCNKTFSQLPHLSTHLALHSSVKPFKCNICGKTFAIQSYLSNHLKIHNKNADAPTRNKKVYACFHCGERFNDKCGHCGERFNDKCGHMSHQQKCVPENSSSDEYSSESELYKTEEVCEFVTVNNGNIEFNDENIEINNEDIEINTGNDNFEMNENITIECTPSIQNDKFQYVIL